MAGIKFVDKELDCVHTCVWASDEQPMSGDPLS